MGIDDVIRDAYLKLLLAYTPSPRSLDSRVWILEWYLAGWILEDDIFETAKWVD